MIQQSVDVRQGNEHPEIPLHAKIHSPPSQVKKGYHTFREKLQNVPNSTNK